ncbi:MAG: hypothetical protein ACT6RL_19185 [Neoaquamicrobium sediminum]
MAPAVTENPPDRLGGYWARFPPLVTAWHIPSAAFYDYRVILRFVFARSVNETGTAFRFPAVHASNLGGVFTAAGAQHIGCLFFSRFVQKNPL